MLLSERSQVSARRVSFTATVHDQIFFRLLRAGNITGEGGLLTFADSNWLTSIALPHQLRFVG
jgi:oleate hydratase